jgi:ribonuclease P protein component
LVPTSGAVSRQRISFTRVATFPTTCRLHHKPQFDAVYRRGLRCSDIYFLVLACANTESNPRLGLSISAKSVGNAVNRNRVKRIIRESFRQQQQVLPSIDVVVNSKPAARNASNPALRASIEKHWIDIAKKCAP